MKYKIEWLVRKNPDWLSVNLTTPTGDLVEASINRVNKKGEVFPNFDELRPGGEVEGELWTSEAGKNYLFAPKAVKQGNNAPYTRSTKPLQTDMKKIIDYTDAKIEKNADNKELSIKISSTMRDAVQLAIAEGKPDIETIEKWRSYLWLNWEKTDKDFPPLGSLSTTLKITSPCLIGFIIFFN